MRYVGDYMAVYAIPNDKPFIGRNIKSKRKYGHIDTNAELLKQGINLEDIIMAKANIVEKKSISIKGILNVDADENNIIVEVEDGEAFELATLLSKFDGSEVAISVGDSKDIA